MKDVFDIPQSLREAIDQVSMQTLWRRDLDLDPIVMKSNDKSIDLMEVYQGSIPQFTHSAEEQKIIHDQLKATIVNDSLKKYMRNSTSVNDHLWKLHNSEISIGDKPNWDAGCKEISNCLHTVTNNQHIKLYSGLPVSPAHLAAFKWNPTKERKLIHFPSFVSTTTNIGTSIGFARRDASTDHYNEDHHGYIANNARHVIQLNFDGGSSELASIRHVANPSEHEVLMGHGHTFELHHRPTLLNSGSASPVYLWHAYNGEIHWNRTNL